MAIKNLYPEIKPSLNLDFANTKQLDPRITFTRATPGNYYDGKTFAKAEENLLKYSQDFDNAAWSASGTAPAVTANVSVSPDGTSTADRIVFPSADSKWRQAISLAAGESYTISIYARSNTGVDQVFRLLGQDATFNSGDLIATTNWQRFTYTFTATGTASYAHGVRTSSGNAGADLLIWGAQLEQRSSVTAYTPTTTQPITNYIPVLMTAPAGVARFDHNPVTGESLGLLVEKSSTNLLTYSEQFSNAAWGKIGSTSVSAAVGIAPDGTLTADRVSGWSTVDVDIGLSRSYTVSPTTITMSVYVKGEGSNIGKSTTLLIKRNTVGTMVSSSKTLVLTGEWQRVSETIVMAADNTEVYVSLSGAASGVDASLRATSALVWGAQLEAGGFPTSYIKTEASQVTRNADDAKMTGANFSGWYRQDEGTLYAEQIAGNVSTSQLQKIAVALRENATNQISLGHGSGGVTNVPAFWVQVTNDQAFLLPPSPTITAGSVVRCAAAFRVNDFAFSPGGSSVYTDLSGLLPRPSELYIGRTPGNTAHYANGTIKRITYYPARLTNAQLQALTTE
jgi:hypothetical protein